jgi:hypothetical protein
MAATFDRPPRNPHTVEQLEVMHCRHLYRVSRATYERVGTQPPSRPGMRPSLPVTCERCGVIRIVYPGERMQDGETLILTSTPAPAAGEILLEGGGEIVDETVAAPEDDAVDLPLRRPRDRR